MEYSKEVLERVEEIKYWVDAILDGKDVEVNLQNGQWVKVDYRDLFSSFKKEYRVKPQQKYVPFTFKDAKDLIGKAVIKKDDKVVRLIIGILESEVCMDAINVYFETLLDRYTFLDGTPCGKLENQ